MGIESGGKGAKVKIEKVEGKRKRRARGMKKRMLTGSIKKELVMIFMLKYWGSGVLMNAVYADPRIQVRQVDGWKRN